MKERCTPACECTARNDLVLRVVQRDLEQTSENIERVGAYWGNNANTALMTLARCLAVNYILDPDNDFEQVKSDVEKYLSLDLRIFTLEADSHTIGEMADVGKNIREQATKYAIPVFKAAMECEDVRHKSETLIATLQDALSKVALPDESTGDYAGTFTGRVGCG